MKIYVTRTRQEVETTGNSDSEAKNTMKETINTQV